VKLIFQLLLSPHQFNCKTPGTGTFSLLFRPDQFWNPPILLSSGYRRLFPWEQNGRSVKVTLSSI